MSAMTVGIPVASARKPSSPAPTPPRPSASPIAMPEARPMWLGRYSWLMTSETAIVPMVVAPISALSAIATAGPPRRKSSRRGVSGRIDIHSTVRRGKRSAIRPVISVAIPPPTTITVSAVLPKASDAPSSRTK